MVYLTINSNVHLWRVSQSLQIDLIYFYHFKRIIENRSGKVKNSIFPLWCLDIYNTHTHLHMHTHTHTTLLNTHVLTHVNLLSYLLDNDTFHNQFCILLILEATIFILSQNMTLIHFLHITFMLFFDFHNFPF